MSTTTEFVTAAVALSQSEEAIKAAGITRQQQFVQMLSAYSAAKADGVDDKSLREALDADQQESGAVIVSALSAGSWNTTSLLADVSAKDGDLPDGWDYSVALVAGSEKNAVETLVRSVVRPQGTVKIGEDDWSILAILKEVGKTSLKGKVAASKIIDASTTKEEAIAALQARVDEVKAIVREFKASKAQPKTAERHAKAAAGPASKIVEALNAGHIGDAEEVKKALLSIQNEVARALAHSALA